MQEWQRDLYGHTKSAREVGNVRHALCAARPLIERVFDLPVILTASIGLHWVELAQDDQTRPLAASGATPFLHMWRISTTMVVSASSFCRISGASARRWVATQIVPLSGTPARISYVPRPEEGRGWSPLEGN
jgi:hypothetical protein